MSIPNRLGSARSYTHPNRLAISALYYIVICMTDRNPNAVTLGSLGGRSKSPKKQEAARINGKKGGKPKKQPIKA